MIKCAITLLVTLVFFSHSIQASVIDNLAEELSKQPMWQNGLSPRIDLPKSATSRDIVSAYFRASSEDRGKIQDWTIKEEKQVQISTGISPDFTAVLCATNFGDRILLMQHSAAGYWWARSFVVALH